MINIVRKNLFCCVISVSVFYFLFFVTFCSVAFGGMTNAQFSSLVSSGDSTIHNSAASSYVSNYASSMGCSDYNPSWCCPSGGGGYATWCDKMAAENGGGGGGGDDDDGGGGPPCWCECGGCSASCWSGFTEVDESVYNASKYQVGTVVDSCSSCACSCSDTAYCIENPIDPKPTCGNGTLESGETCERNDPSGNSCSWNSCNQSTCTCTTPPEDDCGNGTLDDGEECEINDPSGNSCTWTSNECSQNSCTCDNNPPEKECSTLTGKDKDCCEKCIVTTGKSSGAEYEACVQSCLCEPCECVYPNCDVYLEDSYFTTVRFKLGSNKTNSYNYTTKSYSGQTNNNPVSVIVNYYNLSNDTTKDLEALYFWMTEDGVTVSGIDYLATGITISETGTSGKVLNNNNFGFMLKKKDINVSKWEGNYDIYVPVVSGGAMKWAKYSSSIAGSFYIYGSAGKQMVSINNLTLITNGLTSSAREKIKVTFVLEFLNIESGRTYGTYEEASGTMYKVDTMALNEFTFTPYAYYQRNSGSYGSDGIAKMNEHYPANKIRHTTNYTNNMKWGVDLTSPVITKFAQESNPIVFTGPTQMNIVWSATDANSAISYTVGNAYRLDTSDDTLLTNEKINYNGTDTVLTLESKYNKEVLGKITTSNFPDTLWSRTTEGSTKGVSYSNTESFDLYTNRGGSIQYYLTVYDKAGNYTQSSLWFRLGEWVQTMGGQFYSGGGTNLSTRTLSANLWTQESLRNLYSTYNITEETVDLSTEFLSGDVTSSGSLKTLRNSVGTGIMLTYEGLNRSNVYSTYKSKLEDLQVLEGTDNIIKLEGDKTITGNLSELCSSNGKECKLDAKGIFVEGNLTIGTEGEGSKFTCDGRAVFFVSGSVTVNPDLGNGGEVSNACVFISKGTIYINEGNTKSVSGKLGTDNIYGYFVTDGVMEIRKEGRSSLRDALFVEGGLVALDTTGETLVESEGYNKDIESSIVIRRVLDLEYRNIYPVLNVMYNAKYGKVFVELLGGQSLVFKTESGFKAY